MKRINNLREFDMQRIRPDLYDAKRVRPTNVYKTTHKTHMKKSKNTYNKQENVPNPKKAMNQNGPASEGRT